MTEKIVWDKSFSLCVVGQNSSVDVCIWKDGEIVVAKNLRGIGWAKFSMSLEEAEEIVREAKLFLTEHKK